MFYSIRHSAPIYLPVSNQHKIVMEKFAEVPNNLDAWIETLFTCKPLKENDVKSLCEQVILIHQFVMLPCVSSIGLLVHE